jgi:hypothetical protein
VFWQSTLQALALFASTGLAIWAAVVARTRRSVPGSSVFGWMMFAVAVWSLTSAMHTLVEDTSARLFITKIQYLGVAPVGALWLLFASEYARAVWPADRLLRIVIWIIPSSLLRWCSPTSATTFSGRRSRRWTRRSARGCATTAGRGTGCTPGIRIC